MNVKLIVARLPDDSITIRLTPSEIGELLSKVPSSELKAVCDSFVEAARMNRFEYSFVKHKKLVIESMIEATYSAVEVDAFNESPKPFQCDVVHDGDIKSGLSGIELMVSKDIESRQQLGLKKYGVSVEDSKLPKEQWVNHAYEEALDLSVYLKRLMVEMSEKQENWVNIKQEMPPLDEKVILKTGEGSTHVGVLEKIEFSDCGVPYQTHYAHGEYFPVFRVAFNKNPTIFGVTHWQHMPKANG